MGKRISIVIDEELEKRLRIIQAKQIQKKLENVTFSDIVNQFLAKGLNV